ncbi:hypothetical protein TRICI_001584 [Trichomonascus ciferrii]|uniref:squalene synthase n=1 Tax=Trichomonascus ciferrii TaxID=44093 RepID=A0A642V867_9ASCO|nr:hypothetical protein TRICI_001584 [Trichomonascus ciferrii]
MGKLFDLLLHPDELAASIEAKYPRDPSKESKTLQRCYELLNLTSRSFAAVIQELHPELRDTVMLFYVILRGLDTVEDDMTLANEKKIPLLRGFKDVLAREDWTFHESGPNEKDRVVLEEFDKVLVEFHRIKKEYQEVIVDITDKMGNGMADYIVAEQQKNYEGVKTVDDYTTYCHHVAGVVGEGITRLALISKFGTSVLEEKPQLMESMGQFLQKTNIIRDFREDLDDGRSFWPREVWGKYAKELAEFTDPANEERALFCVSDLTVLSLQHVTELLEYLQNVREETLFSFCAIPQVMSIATLELIFNNPAIFHRNVKIRRGLSARLIKESRDMEGVFQIFKDFTRRIHLKNRSKDPNFMRIEVLCGRIEQYIDQHSTRQVPPQKTREDLEREDMEWKLVLSGIAGVGFAFGLMLIVAHFSGARFDLLWEELVDGLKQFTDSSHVPSKHVINKAAKSSRHAAYMASKAAAQTLSSARDEL